MSDAGVTISVALRRPLQLAISFGGIFRFFCVQETIVDYRAGAGAAILTSWSRVKMKQLHNTTFVFIKFFKRPVKLIKGFKRSFQENFFI